MYHYNGSILKTLHFEPYFAKGLKTVASLLSILSGDTLSFGNRLAFILLYASESVY